MGLETLNSRSPQIIVNFAWKIKSNCLASSVLKENLENRIVLTAPGDYVNYTRQKSGFCSIYLLVMHICLSTPYDKPHDKSHDKPYDKFSCIVISFDIFVMMKLIPFDKIFEIFTRDFLLSTKQLNCFSYQPNMPFHVFWRFCQLGNTKNWVLICWS